MENERDGFRGQTGVLNRIRLGPRVVAPLLTSSLHYATPDPIYDRIGDEIPSTLRARGQTMHICSVSLAYVHAAEMPQITTKCLT